MGGVKRTVFTRAGICWAVLQELENRLQNRGVVFFQRLINVMSPTITVHTSLQSSVFHFPKLLFLSSVFCFLFFNSVFYNPSEKMFFFRKTMLGTHIVMVEKIGAFTVMHRKQASLSIADRRMTEDDVKDLII